MRQVERLDRARSAGCRPRAPAPPGSASVRRAGETSTRSGARPSSRIAPRIAAAACRPRSFSGRSWSASLASSQDDLAWRRSRSWCIGGDRRSPDPLARNRHGRDDPWPRCRGCHLQQPRPVGKSQAWSGQAGGRSIQDRWPPLPAPVSRKIGGAAGAPGAHRGDRCCCADRVRNTPSRPRRDAVHPAQAALGIAVGLGAAGRLAEQRAGHAPCGRSRPARRRRVLQHRGVEAAMHEQRLAMPQPGGGARGLDGRRVRAASRRVAPASPAPRIGAHRRPESVRASLRSWLPSRNSPRRCRSGGT